MSKGLIVIAAGGTGGHMFPAEALADELLTRGWQVALASDARGLRYAGGFPDGVARHELKAASFARGGLLAKLTAPLRILVGITRAVSWFRRERPAAVVGFGGYPSLPALSAAVILNIPRIVHEQNSVLGRVNRLFAGWVQHVALGIEPVVNAPASARLASVGNPVRASVRGFAVAPLPDQPSLLVFGGSQGASVFSEVVPGALALLPEEMRAGLRLTQQVRDIEVDDVQAAYREIGIDAETSPFFPDMPSRIAEASLVIARAGASTLAELAFIGRGAILVPLPIATRDHQTMNARAFAESGAGLVIQQGEFTPERLATQLQALLSAPARLEAMAGAAHAHARPAATTDLADLVEGVSRRGI